MTVANGVDATRLPSYSPKALAAAIWAGALVTGVSSADMLKLTTHVDYT